MAGAKGLVYKQLAAEGPEEMLVERDRRRKCVSWGRGLSSEKRSDPREGFKGALKISRGPAKRMFSGGNSYPGACFW